MRTFTTGCHMNPLTDAADDSRMAPCASGWSGRRRRSVARKSAGAAQRAGNRSAREAMGESPSHL